MCIPVSRLQVLNILTVYLKYWYFDLKQLYALQK